MGFMKIIGILGGMGPESTVDYYKGIINGYRKIKGENNYPQIYLNSINMTKMLEYVRSNEYEKLIDLLILNINKLESIGADFVAISSNTPHIVIDEIIKKVDIPIINIVEETRKAAQNKRLKKTLLTGTLFTMNSTFFQKEFSQNNIECIVPDDIEKKIIQDIIFPDLENGIINEKDKATFIKICNKITIEENIDGIILGCTELPLLIKETDFNISVLNTMEIHINSIVKSII
jgi:aspartate racemase